MAHHFFTSESVTEGHPDKICDQISDAILNEILAQDPYARVACETTCTTGMVQVMGEISTSCYVDIPKIARDTVREIGYDRAKYGFDCDTCAVLTAIDEQSADIALGVDNSLESKEGASEADLAIGAGDQGMMFGYACDETPEPLIPPYPGHCAPYNSPLTGRPGQTAPEALSGLPDPPGSRTVHGQGTYPHISGKYSPHRPYTGDSSSVPRSSMSRPRPPGFPAEDPGCKDP